MMKIICIKLILIFNLFIIDQRPIWTTVVYDTIEFNTVLSPNKNPILQQFVFWKDGCSQGYINIDKSEFIDGPIKSADYYEILAKHKKTYYLLKSKRLIVSKTDYDVEMKDIANFPRDRKYNVRLW